jgi:hypothetical protein
MRTGLLILSLLVLNAAQPGLPHLRVSPDKRFLQTEKGEPFFWLGDTGWLLLTRLTNEQTDQYLEDRRKKGFNVIQVMLVHGLTDTDAYGDSALNNKSLFSPGEAYWQHLDYVVNKAAEKGIYLALVPIWGGVVKAAKTTTEQAKAYATFLAHRYTNKSNIIWMNGGDIKGADYESVWNTIGATLKAEDPNHLVTFHPRGRASSSFWFGQQPWLDFNSVQSGHKSYEQDTSREDPRYGEDNWRYIEADYKKTPTRPVVDAEPSYEQIPHGLHDTTQPRWTADDIRRYAYWSVFAGAFGFTYGNNSVMQMHRPSDKGSAYGAKEFWYNALNDPGASQMSHLKKLMLSRSYFDRIPDQSLIADQGKRYDYLVATRGKDYAFIYTYTGRTFTIKPSTKNRTASWYNPRTGETTAIGAVRSLTFDPPGEPRPGNDWVLILDKSEK